jgi:hypothetical protein
VNFLTSLALVAALGATPQVSPGPSASAALPVATPAPATSPAASLAPVLPSAPPSAGPLPVPAATTAPESYKYRFVPRQPDHPAAGVPQIFAVYLNDETLRSMGPIQIKVTTSNDAVKVVSEANGHQGVIPEIVPGDFEAISTLPKVPFIASGMTLYLQFVATGPTGAKTSVRVPVKLL